MTTVAEYTEEMRQHITDILGYVLPLDVIGAQRYIHTQIGDLILGSPLAPVQKFVVVCYLTAAASVDEEAKERLATIIDEFAIKPEHLALIKPAMDRALRQGKPEPYYLINDTPKYIIDAIDQLVVAQFGNVHRMVTLHDIDRETMRHRLQEAGYAAIRRIPLFEKTANSLVDLVKRQSEILLRADGLIVTDRSQPTLHSSYREVVRRLGCVNPPPLYMHGTGYHLKTLGAESPAISMPSMVTTFFEPPEMRFLLGREIGHIMGGHLRLRASTQMVIDISDGLAANTLGVMRPVMDFFMNKNFYYWMRASELTADRYGLLACQDIEAALRALMKQSGFPMKFSSEINTSALIQQSEDYLASMAESRFDRQLAWLDNISRDNHYVVIRTAELLSWIRSGEYAAMLRKGVEDR